MKKNELMIGIPTKDHPKYMQYYLSRTLVAARKYGIDICIYDSSEDNSTEQIVEERRKQGFDNLYYFKYEPSTLEGIKMRDMFVNSDYEYVWLCGDGIVLDIEKTISIVKKEMNKKKDIIIFSFFKEFDVYNEYTNPLKMILETWNPISLFGGAIYRGNLFSEMEWESLYEIYGGNIHFVGFFDLLSQKDISNVSIVTDFFKENPYKNEATWVQNGRILEVETYTIPKAADDLPALYNPVKHKVRKLFADNGDTFKMSKSWYLRKYDNLNLKKVFKYRKELKKITSTPWIWFLFVSIVPQKIALNISKIFSEE